MPETPGLSFEILCVTQCGVFTVHTMLPTIIERLVMEKRFHIFLPSILSMQVSNSCIFFYCIVLQCLILKMLFEFIYKCSEFNKY